MLLAKGIYFYVVYLFCNECLFNKIYTEVIQRDLCDIQYNMRDDEIKCFRAIRMTVTCIQIFI